MEAMAPMLEIIKIIFTSELRLGKALREQLLGRTMFTLDPIAVKTAQPHSLMFLWVTNLES